MKSEGIARPGHPIYKRRNSLLIMSQNIYEPNVRALEEHFNFISNNNVATNTQLHKDRFEIEHIYIIEFQRLLYNYLTSRSSVIDLARNIHSSYPIATYEQVTNTFKMAPENRFLGDLRNFVSHKDIAPVVQESSLRIDKSGAKSKYSHTLSSSQLLDSGWSWNKEATEYLNSIERIDLLELVPRNHDQVASSVRAIFDAVNQGSFEQ